MAASREYHRNRGRGAGSNETSRYVRNAREAVDDGWFSDGDVSPQTRIYVDASRTIITRNQSPDVPFEYSVNPYKGCEHGCIYCFARPTHAWLDLSPGLDFETRIFTKPDAPELLERELSGKHYRPAVIALGANTDAYQPIERKLGITRRILEILKSFRNPAAIVTKSALIERDIDLLAAMARDNLVQVMVSVTSLDAELARCMEPRAVAPQGRLQVIRKLAAAGIPVGVLFAPVIPALNDHEMETVLAECAAAGATSAGYVVLRLPHEVKDLFKDWLTEYYPLKAGHVMSRIRDLRNGHEYESRFGQRMSGSGHYATLIARRFTLACRKSGLDRPRSSLDCSGFAVPSASGDQLGLF